MRVAYLNITHTSVNTKIRFYIFTYEILHLSIHFYLSLLFIRVSIEIVTRLFL